MEAVILAAGQGRRLGEFGKPKGFLQFGRKPMVEESIDLLFEHGIESVTLVTGYQASCYDELAGRWPKVRTVHNALFDKFGSLLSLCRAASFVSGEFLLLESDLVYEERAITGLLEDPNPNVVVITEAKNTGEEFYAVCNGLRLVDIVPAERPPPGAVGEFIGISKLSAANLGQMLSIYFNLLLKEPHLNYELGLVAMARRHGIQAHFMSKLLWGDVDNQDHCQRMTTTIYPAIAAARARRSSTLKANYGIP